MQNITLKRYETVHLSSTNKKLKISDMLTYTAMHTASHRELQQQYEQRYR